MKARLGRVSEKVASRKRRGVIYIGPAGFTAGKGTFIDSVINRAGGRNLAVEAGIKGHQKLSLELTILLDPDAVMLISEPVQVLLPGTEFMASSAVRRMKAVREGKVFPLQQRYFTAPSHHIVKIVEDLATFLHPDAFAKDKSAEIEKRADYKCSISNVHSNR
jgi:iron complex transport system substrate-binding protein